MAELPTPHDAARALVDLDRAQRVKEPGQGRRVAYRLGESTAEHDLTIEETFQLLEREAGEILAELSAEILGLDRARLRRSRRLARAG